MDWLWTGIRAASMAIDVLIPLAVKCCTIRTMLPTPWSIHPARGLLSARVTAHDIVSSCQTTSGHHGLRAEDTGVTELQGFSGFVVQPSCGCLAKACYTTVTPRPRGRWVARGCQTFYPRLDLQLHALRTVNRWLPCQDGELEMRFSGG